MTDDIELYYSQYIGNVPGSLLYKITDGWQTGEMWGNFTLNPVQVYSNGFRFPHCNQKADNVFTYTRNSGEPINNFREQMIIDHRGYDHFIVTNIKTGKTIEFDAGSD